MKDATKIIEKLSTIHADVKNTNGKLADIAEKVDKMDTILRGNGSTVGLCSKVERNSLVCNKFGKLEKRYVLMAIALVVIVLGGQESIDAIVKMIIPIAR